MHGCTMNINSKKNNKDCMYLFKIVFAITIGSKLIFIFCFYLNFCIIILCNVCLFEHMEVVTVRAGGLWEKL